MPSGILVAGSIIVDNIYDVSKCPKSGELTKILAIKKSVGGLVSNVAIDLKRLDPWLPVFAAGRIAEDENGSFVRATLASEGVDVSNLTISSTKTSFTDVISEVGGQRTFLNYPGASSEFGKDDVNLDEIDPKMLHLGYFLLLDKMDQGDGLELLKEAQSKGIVTSIDLVSENSNRYGIVQPVLPYVDNLIVNEYEASKLTGMEFDPDRVEPILKALKAMGVKDRVILHSVAKSYMLRDGIVLEQKSMDMTRENILGSTGAGDAFVSGVLYGVYHGSNDQDILAFAAKAAAISLLASDATSAVCSAEEVEAYFNERKSPCSSI